ncbi:MAG: hypothetical protein ACTHK2_18070 [Dokdonella sp.]|uniref:hypothetical protein n=1 Tax=Dokdonella sp. TaxID=2291710 RepID=UPI003F7D3A40
MTATTLPLVGELAPTLFLGRALEERMRAECTCHLSAPKVWIDLNERAKEIAQASAPADAPVATDWHAAFDEERRKFQLETLRTSEQADVLRRMIDVLKDDHEPGPWSRNCSRCALVAEARELLARPVNAPQLRGFSVEWLARKLAENDDTDAAAVPAAPPAPASGAVSDEDVRAYRKASKDTWLSNEDIRAGLESFASRHASQPAGAELDDAPKALLRELRGPELRKAAIRWRAERNIARSELRGRTARIERMENERNGMFRALTNMREECKRLSASPAQAVSVPMPNTGTYFPRCDHCGCLVEDHKAPQYLCPTTAAPSPPQHDNGSA